MLEEVRKMISEPPHELTTLVVLSTEPATVHVAPLTTTEAVTTQLEEMTIPTTVLITTTPAPETETIFIPMTNENNQNINVYDEKVSNVTTESPRVSF